MRGRTDLQRVCSVLRGARFWSTNTHFSFFSGSFIENLICKFFHIQSAILISFKIVVIFNCNYHTYIHMILQKMGTQQRPQILSIKKNIFSRNNSLVITTIQYKIPFKRLFMKYLEIFYKSRPQEFTYGQKLDLMSTKRLFF